MELEGSLTAFSLPEVLQFLGLGRMTGVLTLRRGEEHTQLSLLRGKIANSLSGQHETRLGELLVRQGLLSRQTLHDAIEAQRQDPERRPIGQLLIDRDQLDPGRLARCLRIQLEEEIWDLFNWQTGEFKFEHRPPEAIAPIAAELDIELLIMEGTRRLDEWKIINQVLVSPDMVLAAQAPPADSPAPELSPAQWRVLAAVDGFSTLNALPQRCGLSLFETCHTVYTLLQAGCLTIAGQLGPDLILAPDARALPLDDAPADADTLGLRALGRRSFAARGWRALLGPDKSPARGAVRQEFATVISLLADYLTHLIAATAASAAAANATNGGHPLRDRNGGISPVAPPASDAPDWGRGFLLLQWQRLLMRYPKADLVRATGFGLDASRFDRYTALCAVGGIGGSGVPRELRDCADDTLAALRAYLELIYAALRQRQGARAARRTALALADAYGTVAVQHGDGGSAVDLRLFVESALDRPGG